MTHATPHPKTVADIVKKIWREIKRPFQQMFFGNHAHSRYSDWNVESEELKKLYDRLVANTDELSREVAARFVARNLFLAKHARSQWNTFSEVLSLIHPLDYEDQERIKALGRNYQCPYKFPRQLLPEHRATHFSLNQVPVEIQRKIRDKDIIDGGGFLGDSAMVFTEYNPRKIYTFEPNPDTLPIIRQVVEDNAAVLGDRKDRIEIVPLALGRSKGKLTFHSNGECDGSATTLSQKAHKTNSYEVDVISIDDFAEERALNVGLIKLDVEGAEYDTILGAKKTILKSKPLLLISIYHSFRDFFEIKPMMESWGMDYQFEIRHHCPSLPDCEFMLIAY